MTTEYNTIPLVKVKVAVDDEHNYHRIFEYQGKVALIEPFTPEQVSKFLYDAFAFNPFSTQELWELVRKQEANHANNT